MKKFKAERTKFNNSTEILVKAIILFFPKGAVMVMVMLKQLI